MARLLWGVTRLGLSRDGSGLSVGEGQQASSPHPLIFSKTGHPPGRQGGKGDLATCYCRRASRGPKMLCREALRPHLPQPTLQLPLDEAFSKARL